MNEEQKAQFVLLITKECPCERMPSPLKKLFGVNVFTTDHKFEGKKQMLYLDISYRDTKKMKQKVRKFKKENENCYLIERNVYQKPLQKKDKYMGLVNSASSVSTILANIFNLSKYF